jgi:hypothetical protein
MADHPKPVRSVTALDAHDVAHYTLSITIMAAQPALDEKRVRKLIDEELVRLAATLKNSK